MKTQAMNIGLLMEFLFQDLKILVVKYVKLTLVIEELLLMQIVKLFLQFALGHVLLVLELLLMDVQILLL